MEVLSIIGTIMTVLGLGLVLFSRQKLLDKSVSATDKSRHQWIYGAGIFLLVMGVLAQLAEVYGWL